MPKKPEESKPSNSKIDKKPQLVEDIRKRMKAFKKESHAEFMAYLLSIMTATQLSEALDWISSAEEEADEEDDVDVEEDDDDDDFDDWD